MFESYSSRANQSAVEKLIQLATGKKDTALAEEEPVAAPEAVERASEPAEAFAEPVQSPAMEGFADPQLQEFTHASTIEAVLAEAEAEMGAEAARLREAIAHGFDGRLDERPFHELVQEPVEEPAAEHAPFEPVTEAAPAEAFPEEAAAVSAPAVEEAGEHEPASVAEAGQPFAEAVVGHESPFEAAVTPSHDEAAVATPETEPRLEAVAEQVSSEPTAEAGAAPEVAVAASFETHAEPAAAESDEPVGAEPAEPLAALDSTEPVAAAEPVEAVSAVEPAAHEVEAESAEPVVAEPVSSMVEEATDAQGFDAAAQEVSTEVAAEAGPAEWKEESHAGGGFIGSEHGVEEPSATLSEEAMASAVAGAVAQDPAVRSIPSASERLRAMARNSGAESSSYGSEQPAYGADARRRASTEPWLAGSRGADVVPSPGETTYLRSKTPDGQPDLATEEELRQLSQDPMWKTLVQFKAWLPVVTRVLPLLDMARNRAQSAGGTSEEMREAMEGLLVSHRDVRTTLQSQTTELKRVEDEVVKLRESMDKTAFEQTTAADDMKSMQRLVKHASMYIGIVLGLLVAAVGYMAFLVFSYLNHPTH
ncbi:MAG: hypothetical protein ACLGPM_09740 [Acidobacteriota bacterium]